ncbi:MAG: molybdenum cofactor biosynthesis protein MoaE [Alphaproteobacteria bacterium]|nr:molybdenum cofactor biosynthesis protein MoaE [Alphaproteobacteria bacterium]MCY4318154.1 molybdenum cofactor biosynthesis protein MoaE [Alphaproteobacteria bacterium]
MIRVQREGFDIGREIAALTVGNPRIGGIASFVGLVRDLGGLRSMTLEHYPGMTERQLARIDAEAHRRWPLEASLIVHRYGRLEPGEPIVLTITASAHRQTAFDSCNFLMDWLKTEAPFWKREEAASGEHWVAAHADDDAARDRWQETG